MHFVNAFSKAVLECGCCDPTPWLMPTLHFTLMYGQAFRPLSLGLFMGLSVLLDWSHRAVNELVHIPEYSILFLLSRQFVLPVFV